MAPLPAPTVVRAVLYSLLLVAALAINWSIQTHKLLPTVLVVSICMQVFAFVSIPGFVFFMRWMNRRARDRGEPENRDFLSLPSKWGPITFCVVCLAWYLAVEMVDELMIWKYASAVQVFAYAVLVLKVLATRSVAGISAGKLALDALSLGCRSLAMSWALFRMPREAGNDFIRLADGVSLFLVLVLLGASRVVFRSTYTPLMDSFGIAVPALACVGLALVFHADVGHAGFLPDTIWTMAHYLDAVAMLPQLHLIAQSGGFVDEATAHHMALVFCSRLMGVTFWWNIKGHWFQGLSYTGCGIMIVYYLQLLLLSNFLCWYLKSICSNGIFSGPIACAEKTGLEHEHES